MSMQWATSFGNGTEDRDQEDKMDRLDKLLSRESLSAIVPTALFSCAFFLQPVEVSFEAFALAVAGAWGIAVTGLTVQKLKANNGQGG
jgi:hypothetical protein